VKSLLLAAAMVVTTGVVALADGRYWVVGNSATSKCDIVTSNPVINGPVGGNVAFGDGPYKSFDDAKLARSTIGVCPKDPPAKATDANQKASQ